MEPIFTKELEIDGQPWRFVVYPGGSYTLIDPDGRHIPPMDHLSTEEIDALRAEATK